MQTDLFGDASLFQHVRVGAVAEKNVLFGNIALQFLENEFAVFNHRYLALVGEQDARDVRARLAAADDDHFHLYSPASLTEGQAHA